MTEIEYLVLIGPQNKKTKFIKFLGENGAHCIETVYGKGSANTNAFKRAIGLDPDIRRAVITCLIGETEARKVIDKLNEEFGFDKENTGIAFAIPVEGLSF